MEDIHSPVNKSFGINSDLHSPLGGAGSLPNELSISDFIRAFNESISVEVGGSPDVLGERYIPLDKFSPDIFPELVGDDDSDVSGEAVGHSQYKFQKRLLSLLMSPISDEITSNDLRSYLFDGWDALGLSVPSTKDYHKVLVDNPSLVSKRLDFWIEAFRLYLEYNDHTHLHIPVKVVYDRATGYAFTNVHYLAKPVTQFNEEYKQKKLNLILKFELATELLTKGKFSSPRSNVGLGVADSLLSRVDPDEFPELYKALESKRVGFTLSPSATPDALWRLLDVMSKPLLFVTITMGNDNPVSTFIKYRGGWNNFFTQLKSLMKALGWEYRYYVKGVETTKSGRLHVHMVFLGVTPSHPSQLVEFKKGLEVILNRVGFGYVNDVELIRSDYNLVIISKTDLMKPEKGFFDADGKKLRDFKILQTFTLPYRGADSVGEATFHLLKVQPSKKGQNWERVVRYVFKYPLKGETYEDVKDDPDKLESWLRSNVLFWVFGVKRWWISKELTKLLNEAFPFEKRFYLFKDEWDFLTFLSHPDDDVYSTIRDLGKFESFIITPECEEDVKPLLSKPTIALFYIRLGLLDPLDNYSPVLGKFRFDAFISPETLNRLIEFDLFKSLINLRWKQLSSLTTSEGVGAYG